MSDTERTPPAPTFPDARTRRLVRDALASARYREATLRELLRIPRGIDVAGLDAGLLRHRVRGVTEPLGPLLALFLVGLDVATERARESLGTQTLDAFRASRLVTTEGDRAHATVRLLPIADLVIACDRVERHRAREADFVLGPGGVTRRLADFTMRRPVESVLDLGSGAGVLGALAASHAQRVVATDVSVRAVAFSQFTAELNDIEHMECRSGSLFDPVADEQFDLILCNPPYVISPKSTFVYRDGGTEVCRAIVRDAAKHLTASGWLEMVVDWPERADEDWRADVRGWFDDACCDAWVLRLYSTDAATYASLWLGQEYQPGIAPDHVFDEWSEYFARMDVRTVGGGVIVLRRSQGTRPHIELRDAPLIADGPAGESLSSWLDAQDFVASLRDDAELLDLVLVPSPDMERRDRQQPTGDGWSGALPQLQLRSGFRFGARVDLIAAELVGLLDGRRTPRAAVGVFAQQLNVPPEPLMRALPEALRRLVTLGLLIPVR